MKTRSTESLSMEYPTSLPAVEFDHARRLSAAGIALSKAPFTGLLSFRRTVSGKTQLVTKWLFNARLQALILIAQPVL